ncbi:unnamed protein product, partial [Scytosiphon promiscuus]
ARPLRGSARLGGGSGPVTPKPSIVDSGIAAATCHRQVGLVLQKGKNLRAGCRFALRVVRTPEEFQEMEKERVEKGVEWARYEMPAPDELDLDLAAYPGLVQAPPKPTGQEAGKTGPDGDVPARLPGIAAVPEAAAAGSGDDDKGGAGGGGGSGDADYDLSNLWVALQGWVKHDVEDTEVRLQPRGALADHPAAAGALVAGRAPTVGGGGDDADAGSTKDDSTD